MTAYEYLEQIKKFDLIIANKSEEYRRLVGLASGLGEFSVSERVQSSKNLQQIPNAIAKYIDLEREIEELKRQRKAIIQTIERLPSAEYEILYKLYVKNSTMKELAWQFDKSYDWVKKKKRNAIQRIQSMIDEEKEIK